MLLLRSGFREMTNVYVVFHKTECNCSEGYDELVGIFFNEEQAKRRAKFLNEEFGEEHFVQAWNVQ